MADDEKSFRERVEEIRERREQERNDDDSHVGQGIRANQQKSLQPNIPDMEHFLEQVGTELCGCQIVVETEDTRLEFHNQSLYKTQTGTGPMCQLIGEPDRKEPIQTNTKSRNPSPATSANATTTVFTPNSNEDSGDQDASIEFCPGCGSNLGSFADAQHCPQCGREL
jgi:hypothetical protein